MRHTSTTCAVICAIVVIAGSASAHAAETPLESHPNAMLELAEFAPLEPGDAELRAQGRRFDRIKKYGKNVAEFTWRLHNQLIGCGFTIVCTANAPGPRR